MRAALISLAGSQPVVAGRSLALRQLDFALAAGCSRIFAIGDGASPEALALTHAAEGAGARCQALRDGRGLLGTLGATDELLVLAPGLLPEAGEALALLAGPGVLVVPAAAGVAAGFERIDLERASAGALVIPGALVERLTQLPPDSEPAAALLRIALQAGVGERRLPEEVLADGSWALVADDAAAEALGRGWLARHGRPTGRYALAEGAAQRLLKPLALRLLAMPAATTALKVSTVALLAGAVGLCGGLSAPAGFAVLALGVLCAALAGQMGVLAAGPFAPAPGRRPWRVVAGWLADIALVGCGALALPGDWLHRLFPPLVLAGALRASAIAGWTGPAALLGDRAVLAISFAVAAAFGHVEPAVMTAALAILALHAGRPAAKRG